MANRSQVRRGEDRHQKTSLTLHLERRALGPLDLMRVTQLDMYLSRPSSTDHRPSPSMQPPHTKLVHRDLRQDR